jgi:hypothetical protein
MCIMLVHLAMTMLLIYCLHVQVKSDFSFFYHGLLPGFLTTILHSLSPVFSCRQPLLILKQMTSTSQERTL